MMKVMLIMFVLTWVVAKGSENYICNDLTEHIKYYTNDITVAHAIHTISKLINIILGIAIAIKFIIEF